MDLLDGHLIPAVDGVAFGLLLFVVAAGLSLAFGTAGVLNLSHGTLYAIGAYTGAEPATGPGVVSPSAWPPEPPPRASPGRGCPPRRLRSPGAGIWRRHC
ncbi:hypothetical protein SGRI78S_01261 [Streptomyces griseus subsp. griseus]